MVAVAQAGFSVAGVRYVRAGTAPTHSLAKRFAKRLLLAVGIANLRLFSPGYVVWAMASRSLGHTPPRARGSAR